MKDEDTKQFLPRRFSTRFSIHALRHTPYHIGNIIRFKGIETIKEYKGL
jgi:hypothetical protein